MLKKLENSFNLKTSMTYLTWMKQTECSKSNKKGKQRNGEHLKVAKIDCEGPCETISMESVPVFS